jgi:hypothetical protein
MRLNILTSLLLLVFLQVLLSCRNDTTPREPIPGVTENQSDSILEDESPSELEAELEAGKDLQQFTASKTPNFQVYNSSSDTLTIRLDKKRVIIPANSSLYEYIPNGKHGIQYNDVNFTFDLAAKERVLINPFRDSIIMEEVLYQRQRNGFAGSAKPEDFTTPFSTVTLGREHYRGPYKMIVKQRLVKGWDFGLGEISVRTIEKESDLYRTGDFSSGHISYFKISTVKEIRDRNVPLNRNDNFINIVLEQKVNKLKEGYGISSKQGNWLVVTTPDGREISVGKASVNGPDDLELHEVNYYDKSKHGNITAQIAAINNCTIVKENKRSKINVGIVLSDNSHQPHVIIVK